MKSFLSKITLSAALIAPVLFQYSCKKVSPLSIDNDEVIQTPYGLYIANTSGMLINTNDGMHFNNVFPPDGYAPIALTTSQENLFMVKENLHASFNNGKNFQMVFDKVSRQEWNEQILDAPLQGKIYVATTEGKGVAYSSDNGRTWQIDDNFNPLIPVSYHITSFAALNDGSVYAFSNENLLLLKKENADAPWTPVTVEGVFPADDGVYFVSSDGQSLFLIESTGRHFHYVSDDAGLHWLKLLNGNIPWGSHIWTATRAPGGNLLIGTEYGVFRFEAPDQLIPVNNGLEIGTEVRRLTYKKNVYKNGATRYFVFAATNKGLFRSEDRGVNWVRTTDTTFQHNYRAMY
ncbi:MAG: hypothetical protein KL787_03105 [Taibaiella sp.]|nr:hypothetical protein [Taibaiella sp.]